MPTVSIIVPIYNSEKTLSRCIDSILTKTYKDFELLLQAASVPNTPAVMTGSRPLINKTAAYLIQGIWDCPWLRADTYSF